MAADAKHHSISENDNQGFSTSTTNGTLENGSERGREETAPRGRSRTSTVFIARRPPPPPPTRTATVSFDTDGRDDSQADSSRSVGGTSA